MPMLQKLAVISKIALPSIFCLLISYSQQLINLYFAGHLHNERALASIGLANSILSCFILSFFKSIDASLETLVSQAFGSGNHDLCAVYLNRGLLCIIVSFIPIVGFVMVCEPLLVFIGQDPVISKITQKYLMWYLPAILVIGFCEHMRKFLNSYRVTYLPLAAFIIAVFFHPFWCQMLVIDDKFWIEGIAMSAFITNFLALTVIYLLIKYY